MSFQDISGRRSAQTGGGAQGASGPAARRGAAPGARHESAEGAIETISSLLRQYQQHVSLLERVGDSLQAQPRASDELLRQVVAQQDVVDELAGALRRGFVNLTRLVDEAPRAEQTRPRAAQAKLQKDFERVAATVVKVVEKIKASRRAALARGGGAYGARGAQRSEAPYSSGRAQFGSSESPGDVDVMIGSDRVQLQVAMQEEAINDAILREREEEIREINQNVHKVNEIFRDLAGLVEKQQADVDQIGELVEKSHAHAEKGLEQVQKAAKMQPSCAIS